MKIILIILVVLVIYIFILYNSLVKLNNKVKEAFATMDVYLKKRWDLIPNLVEIVKSYAKYEEDTLKEITQIRSNIYDDMSYEDKLKANQQLTSNISKLMLLVENYPNLKANENFVKLSDKLIKLEDEIASSRKYYNAVIKIYNNKVEIFPNNLFARILGFKKKLMFEASDEERNNVIVRM